MYSLQKSKAVVIVSVLAIIIGVSVIVGWVFNLPGLETLDPHYDSMKFNPGLCFIFIGAALLLTQFKTTKYNKIAFLALTLLITSIGAVSALQYLFHFNAGIDQLFVTDHFAMAHKYVFPGRMAANTAICFVLFGLSFLGFSVQNRIVQILSQYLLHVITAISSVALIGYLYGLSFFYTLTYTSSIAIHTAILLFLLSITASLLRPSLGISGLFTGHLVGNKMAARLFVLIVLMVLIFGTLRVQSERYKILSTETGVSLLAVCFLFVSLLLIWYTANYLNRIDLKRYEAEEEIKAMNEELEERVEERSSELLNLLDKYRESESTLRAAFEFSAIGMTLVSLEGAWLKVNKRFCEMVGYTEQELLSMSFIDITYPEDIHVHVNPIADTLNNESGTSRIEKRYVCKNGTLVWVSVNFAAIKDNSGKPLYFVSQIEDITERKKAEDAQKLIIENEERLRAIFDNVEGATSLLDTDMRLIVFNKVFSKKQTLLTGREPRIGDELYGFLPPEEKKQRFEIVNRVLKGNKETFEVTHLMNGKPTYFRISFAPVKVNGKVTAISSYSIDLTASKEAENNIRKADARFRAIVESVFVGIKLNDINGDIIYRSPSMQSINGWTDEEMNLNYYKLIHPEDLDKLKKVQGEVLLNPGKAINITYRIKHKNGNYIWIESMLCNKLSDPDLGAIITVTRDVTDRKRMELGLIEAEMKFRTLAEKSMVGVYISQKDRFTYVNPRFAEIFGYEPHELTNTAESIVKIIIDEEDQATVWKHIEARYKGEVEQAHYEVRGKKKDGTYNYVEFYGNSVIIDGEPSIIGTMLDITERKKAEELILREKTLSETIINSLPEVFYLRSVKGEFLRWNKNFEKMTGYTADEIRQLDSRKQLAEEDQGLVKAAVEKMIKEGHATVEARVVTKDGQKVPFLITISPLIYENQPCVLGIAIDISSRLKAEEELRSSEHKYKSLFESNPLPMWMVAKDSLSVIAVNDAAAKLYGYSKDELLKMDITGFRPVEDFGAQLEDWDKNADDLTRDRVIRHYKKDGTMMYVQIIAQDIVFEGKPVRLAFTNDVTERLKAEESLQKSEANLKAIMETTDTAYALLDKKLKVVAYNPMAIEFVKTQYNHIPDGRDKFTDFMPQERVSGFLKNVDKVFKGKHLSYEVSYPQPDGSESWYYIKLFPLTNDKHEIFGLLISASEITERKKAEESLKAAYKLIQDHIASIKDMAWKQSHLIRSPVANLKALAALLNEDPADSKILQFFNLELDRLDSVIIDMAEDASNRDLDNRG